MAKNVMKSRNKNGRIRPFGEVLRKRIDATLALDVIHAALRGEDITRTQLDAARIALGKCLPDLKAVSIDLGSDAPATKADIDALLLSHGMRPDHAFGQVINGHAERVHKSD